MWQIICFFQASLAHTALYGHIILHLSFTRELLPIFCDVMCSYHFVHGLLSVFAPTPTPPVPPSPPYYPSSFCSRLLLRVLALLSARHTALHQAADSNLCVCQCGLQRPTRRLTEEGMETWQGYVVKWKEIYQKQPQIWMEASRCTYKLNIILNGLGQHNKWSNFMYPIVVNIIYTSRPLRRMILISCIPWM